MSFSLINIHEAAWQAFQTACTMQGISSCVSAVKLDEADDVVANLMRCSLFSYVGARI